MARGAATAVLGTVQRADGLPLAGARVVVVRSPVPMPETAALTDAAGRFKFVVPVPGTYVFAAHADELPASVATGQVRVPEATGAARDDPFAALRSAVDPDAEASSEAPPAPSSAAAEPPHGTAELHLTLRFAAGGR